MLSPILKNPLENYNIYFVQCYLQKSVLSRCCRISKTDIRICKDKILGTGIETRKEVETVNHRLKIH